MSANPRVVGLAGRIGSGKTTLARFLAVQYDGLLLPIAAPLKGIGLWVLGPLAYKPQWYPLARQWLQYQGTSLRQKMFPAVWAEMWKQVALSLLQQGRNSIIVPDVRFEEEVAAIRSLGGTILFIGTAQEGDHVSERLPPEACDFHLPLDWSEWDALKKQALQMIGNPSPRKARIYLASNITGDEGFIERYSWMADQVLRFGMEPLLPYDLQQGTGEWLRKLRILSLGEMARTIVVEDLALLSQADGVWAYLVAPSIGVGSELALASLLDLPVAITCSWGDILNAFLHALGEVNWKDDWVGALRFLQNRLVA